jgi:hypothetical protein
LTLAFLLKVRDNTEIGIHPQMSEEELARGIRELTESIDVNPKR